MIRLLLLVLVGACSLHAAVWQWSVPDGEARAYLWIPEDSTRVRGVVVANHNMVEQGILEHSAMRTTLARLGFAEIWVVPYLDATFDFNQRAGERFQRVVDALAAVSGYEELARAPVAGGGPIRLSRIVGPFVEAGPDRFRVRFGRAEYTSNRRNHDLWLVAEHPGDERVRGIVQQAMVRVAPGAEGERQTIEFSAIADQPAGTASLKLAAISSVGPPVEYYVLEGPAEVEGDTLRFTAIPPRAAFPLKVTVVAWQFGRFVEPRVRAAEQVERSFNLVPSLSRGPAQDASRRIHR